MKSVIEVCSVKIFENSSDINFTVNKGESLCIFGMNGSGKTLFIKSLCGLFKPFGGNIICNVDRNLIGVCLQFPEHLIFKQTVYDEACLITGDKKLADELLSELNIDGSNSPFDLSDGEKRLLFMNGLFKSKELLIFDEPFSSLDESSAQETAAKIAESISLGKSVIYTANRHKDTLFASKVITL